MSRRRLIEILVAVAIVVALVAIFLVRPTAKYTGAPPAPLFEVAPGAIPDFTGELEYRVGATATSATKTALLYPAEFEEVSDLFVLESAARGTRFVLLPELRERLTPKNLGWIDLHTLWVTIGHRYGTVAPGGDLHAVDAATGMARLLWASPDSGRTQAVAAEVAPGQGGIVVRLKVFDANMNLARDSSATLPREVLAGGGGR